MNNSNGVSNFIRLGGFITILAGGLMALADIWHTVAELLIPVYSGSAAEQVGSAIFLAGRVLVVLGIPSLYLYQAHAAGRFGVVAFVVVMLGNTLMVGSDWGEVFIAPILRSLDPALYDNPPTRLIIGFIANFAIESLGWLLFGIASYRARVFPRLASGLLILAPLLPFVGPSWIFIVLSFVVTWLGLTIVRTSPVSSMQEAA